MRHLILGTAGHIDHGKTALVQALTGTNTDRLPEEQRRGITIEPGFAHLDLGEFRLGIVDVPGHERFVRQMLSVATAMDITMLVIAADDSINAQTREHLDILKLLRVPQAIVVLTKCDLVDDDWLEMVEAEITEFVAGSMLESQPIVRTSSVTGQGLDQLRQRLVEAAERAAAALSGQPAGPFRMAIDRVFTMAGHGTVVTGSVTSGRARVGDQLEIQPTGHRVRVRGLQSHDAAAEEVARGQRAAINLAGVHHDQVARGDELAEPGFLTPSPIMLAEVRVLANAARPLRDRQIVRLHMGAAETTARVRLCGAVRLEPGATGLAQLILVCPGVAVWGQPIVIRTDSPLATIGGGRIIHPTIRRISKRNAHDLELAARMASPQADERLSAAFYFAPIGRLSPDELGSLAGVSQADERVVELESRGELRRFAVGAAKPILVHRRVIERLERQTIELIKKHHATQPLAAGLSASRIETRLAALADAEVVKRVIESLVDSGQVRRIDEWLALADHGPRLSAGQQRLLDELLAAFLAAGLQPPSENELKTQATHNRQSLAELVQLAVRRGDLVDIGGGILMHRQTVDQARARVIELIQGAGSVSVSDIRQHLNTSRKFVVPLCEYFDRIGVTRRQGDARVLAKPS